MKNLLKISVLCFSMFFMASCSSDDGGGSTDSSSAGWKLNNVNYEQKFMLKIDAGMFVSYLAIDKIPTSDELSNGSNTTVLLNTMSFMFKSVPTAGQYNIVFKSDESQLVEGDVMVTVTNKDTNLRYVNYLATDKKVTVTVNNGKVTITMPEITVTKTGDTSGDTATLSGKLVEQDYGM